MSKSLVELTVKLCSIPSICGDERELLHCVLEILEKLELKTKKIFVPGSNDRFNILVFKHERQTFNTLFCTHLDTVAPFIAPSICQKENKIFGRGSTDAKGIAACMIFALLDQIQKGFDDCALLLTVGEEDASDGAKACNEPLKDLAKFVVVGEPTNFQFASAQKGSLVFDLVSTGKEAHSSVPHEGDSALHTLINDLQKLVSYAWPSHEKFGETFFNVGKLEGGCARNMLAGSAKASCIMRLAMSSAQAIEIIKKNISSKTQMKIFSQTDPFSYVTKKDCETFLAGFGSDAPYLKNVGAPLLFGPGELRLAHRPDEHVRILDLVDGVEKYCELAEYLRTI